MKKKIYFLERKRENVGNMDGSFKKVCFRVKVILLKIGRQRILSVLSSSNKLIRIPF